MKIVIYNTKGQATERDATPEEIENFKALGWQPEAAPEEKPEEEAAEEAPAPRPRPVRKSRS